MKGAQRKPDPRKPDKLRESRRSVQKSGEGGGAVGARACLEADVDGHWPICAAIEGKGHGEALAIEWVISQLVHLPMVDASDA